MPSQEHENEGSEITEEPNEDMDERLATILHLQQLQQKQEVTRLMESHTVTNADAEFRRGLEELVRDHLNTCMVLASCSSAHDSGIGSSSSMHEDVHDAHQLRREEDESHFCCHGTLHLDNDQPQEPDSQVHQTGESALYSTEHRLDNQEITDEIEDRSQLIPDQVRDDTATDLSHLEERPRSRVLSLWAAQHAQEMITTMERQAREAELLALAGLHTVSTLDASFLRESPSRPHPNFEEAERPRRRASSIVQMWRELEEEQRTAQARNDLENMVTFGGETVGSPENSVEIERAIAEGQEETQDNQERPADDETHANDYTDEQLQSENMDYRPWEVNETVERISIHDTREPSQSQSQEGEREHVRQIVQRLMTDNEMRSLSSAGHAQHRGAWLDDNERERVRELAREWVRVTEQRNSVRDARGRSPGRQAQGQTRGDEVGQEGVEDADDNSMLRRSQQRERNRQAILDLLLRAEQERQRELDLLLQHRAVSDFAHRHRLQSLLRGRFLRTGGISEEERPFSSAAGELGQLRQRRAVSGIREGFRFRLETVLQSQVNNNQEDTQRRNAHPVGHRRQTANRPVTQLPNNNVPGSRAIATDAVATTRNLEGVPTNRRIQTMEESTAYNMELQELMGRRSVTNVLASEFRDRLDRLIRSFLQTQGRTPVAWDLTRGGRIGPSPPQQQQQQRQREQQQQRQQQPPAGMPPPPPPPPPFPIWQPELQQGTWARPPLHRPSYLELESINELKSDISKLQHGMSDLQRMMETCMEMQLELQRSVRQELSGALQRLYDGKDVPEEAIDGTRWVSVRRGICCVCCDRNIDSLLYRCGHMCTCLKCASELIRNSGKCPMCRAPIVEVVRAFTVA